MKYVVADYRQKFSTMQWIDFRQTVSQRSTRQQLDQEQNRAKNFAIQGHSLVRGVAGSGKSLILRDRVSKMTEENIGSVLVLTYNRFMSGWTQAALGHRKSVVECRTFHSWAYRNIEYTYEYDKCKEDREKAIERAANSNKKYQAILIDEAQDFYDEWFQALLKVLDEKTNSLFFVYDNTQSVYGQSHRRKRDWSWAKLGLSIPGGRSQIFDLNYRNSPEVLELSWKFIRPAIEKTDMRVDSRRPGHTPTIDKIIKPKKKLSRSSGIDPILMQINRSSMPREVALQVKKALLTYPESSIGILVPPRHAMSQTLKEEIHSELNQVEVTHHAPMCSRERDSNVVDRPYVILDSWNALKGVEFDAVIIAGIDLLSEQADIDADFEGKAGLYTAMTRTRDHLVMLYESTSPIVKMIESAMNSPSVLDFED